MSCINDGCKIPCKFKGATKELINEHRIICSYDDKVVDEDDCNENCKHHSVEEYDWKDHWC